MGEVQVTRIDIFIVISYLSYLLATFIVLLDVLVWRP